MSDVKELERRLAYLGISGEDQVLLRRLKEKVDSELDRLVADFYGHLLSFEETRDLLRDPAVRDRLLESQRRYLESLISDDVDEAYVAQRLRIGQVHERIGLEPRWYLGAYELHQDHLDRIIDEVLASEPDVAAKTRAALRRRLFLDIELAMQAYIDKREEQLEFANTELAKSHLGLMKEVGEKSEALRETTVRAQAAEQLAAVGVLAAGLAHEIGTPMGVIRGHAESLTGAVRDERSRWRIETIIEQIDRITNVMQSLLNLARPRAPVVEEVKLESVIDTALSFLEEKLRRRHIEIDKEVESAPSVLGDGEKLQQLFLNLILNAADAMPEGGRLGIRVEKQDAQDLVASVSDTGVGIDAEDLPRVFEPFFTTKASGQGNGLGLVVARGIAIDHGGDLTVESEKGRGTTFRLVLPLSSAHVPPSSAHREEPR